MDGYRGAGDDRVRVGFSGANPREGKIILQWVEKGGVLWSSRGSKTVRGENRLA